MGKFLYWMNLEYIFFLRLFKIVLNIVVLQYYLVRNFFYCILKFLKEELKVVGENIFFKIDYLYLFFSIVKNQRKLLDLMDLFIYIIY